MRCCKGVREAPTPSSGTLLLLVSNSAWNLWHFRRSLWQGLLAQGYRVAVLCPDGPEIPWLEAAGIQCYTLRWLEPTARHPLQEIRLWLELRRWYRSLRPGLIFHFTIKPNLWGSLAAAGAGIPAVATLTGLGTPALHGGLRYGLVRFFYRLALRQARQVVIQNPDDQAFLTTPALLIPGSGIDMAHYEAAPWPTGQPWICLYLGRMLQDKGLRELGDAWQASGLAARGALLQLAGSYEPEHPGSLTPQAWTALLALPGVQYLGELSDVRVAIQNARLVVLPSYREGMPRSLLEALSMGRPVLATDVPGCRQLALNARTGWCVPARNGYALADALRQAFDSSDAQLEDMGLQGRQLVEGTYSQQQIQAAYLGLAQQLLQQPPSAHNASAEVVHFFDQRAATYTQRNAFVRWQHQQRLEATLALLPTQSPARLLDVGCGQGVLYEALLQARGEAQASGYVGLDPSAAMLRQSPIPDNQQYVGSLADWAGQQPHEAAHFELICWLGVSTYLSPTQLAADLALARRFLAPHGQMVVSFTHASSFENRWRRRLSPLVSALLPGHRVWSAPFPTYHYHPTEAQVLLEQASGRCGQLSWLPPSFPFLHHFSASLALWAAQRLKKSSRRGWHTDFLVILQAK